ncbi:hypothetical protein [Pseudodesulfovibrio sp. JC047]|nr:hypothetical protein [Pseudodesulfovibrio sp. JC047]
MIRLKNFCQHIFNPLHLFCRLRQAGLSVFTARHLCRVYERGLYRFFF